jgi:hypothetical protein
VKLWFYYRKYLNQKSQSKVQHTICLTLDECYVVMKIDKYSGKLFRFKGNEKTNKRGC